MPVRAHTLAVNSCLNLSWAEFGKLLHACWGQATALANWSVWELARNDLTPLPGMAYQDYPLCPCPCCSRPNRRGKAKGKPRTKGLYLYGHFQRYEARGQWKGSAGAANNVLRRAQKKYDADRFDILFRRAKSLPTFRYPHPYPVDADDWSAEIRDGKPVLVVRLPGVAEKVELQLRGGAEFGRQLAAFREIARGNGKKRELLITRQRASAGCHRRTAEGREPGGGAQTHYRIMVKLVVDLPEKAAPGPRVLTLCTDPAALWAFGVDGRRELVLNEDHIRRAVLWQEKHKARRQRWSQDCKAERRSGRRKRRQFQGHRDAGCSKYERRMDSWCKETAAHVAGFAARQKVGHVLYLDRATGYLPIDCMHRMKSALANALAGHGIALDCATDEEAKEVERSILPPEGESQTSEEMQCLRLMKLYEMAQRRLLATEARLSRSRSSPAVSAPSAGSPTSPSGTRSTCSAASRASRKRTPRSAASAKPAR